MKLVLRPGAQADVAAASEYYQEPSPELVEDFIDELDRLLARLAESPGAPRKWRATRRYGGR